MVAPVAPPTSPHPTSAYSPRRTARSEFIPVRTLRYHLRTWGNAQLASADAPPLVMLHGWMDVSASFQFVVDALEQERFIVAPDWRGYGKTQVPNCDSYWMPDYLADLDFVLDAIEKRSGSTQVDLIGHSLGGNVAMAYAGVRPRRIRRLVNLEGFGMPRTQPQDAGARYAQWIDQLKELHAGRLDLRTYDSAEGVAKRLMKNNPRLGADKAVWLATHWSAPNPQGQWEIEGDRAHKVINACLSRVEETLALYRAIEVPVLCVQASENQMDRWWRGRYTLEEYHARLACIPNVRIAQVEQAGHMLHHDQPGQLAALLESFLRT